MGVPSLVAAARLVRGSPLFTAVTVLSLAVGIAGTSAVFSVGDALLLRRLPGIPEPERLVAVARTDEGLPGFGNLSYPNLVDIRAQNTSLEALAAIRWEPLPLGLGSDAGADRVLGTLVSGTYFDVLRPGMALGRPLRSGDDRPDEASACVLTYRLWQRRFDGDPNVVGEQIRLNGQPFTIIGVAAKGFRGDSLLATDLWVPVTRYPALLGEDERMLTTRRAAVVSGIGRLKPDVTLAQAQAEMDLIARNLAREYPADNQGRGITVNPATPLPGTAPRSVAAFVGILFLFVALIFLLACANVSGMILARGADRARDTTVRLSLGAGRLRIMKEFVTEGCVLAFFSVIAGLMGAAILTSLLARTIPALPLSIDIDFRIDWRLILFSAAVGLLAAVSSSILPALRLSKADLTGSTKSDSREVAGSQRLRQMFVSVQVAISLLLVVCALLLGRSLVHANQISPGFEVRGLEAIGLSLRLGGYQPGNGRDLLERLVLRVNQLPGVESAATSVALPLIGTGYEFGSLRRPGDPSDGESAIQADWNVVSPSYFETLRIPIVRGRAFAPVDREGAPAVAIVNETFARRVWPGRDAIGQRLVQTSRDEEGVLEIVGVAQDAKYRSLGEDPRAFIYVPLAQQFNPDQWLMVRHRGTSVVPQVRTILRQLDPNLPVIRAMTLDDASGLGLLPARLAAWTATAVGVIGLFLSAIGIYGITAYAVTRRTREIGVRVALGATPWKVVALITRQTFAMAAFGLFAGLVAARWGTGLLTTLLYGVAPLDRVSFAGATIFLAAVVLAACGIPAWRAVSLRPAEALRTE